MTSQGQPRIVNRSAAALRRSWTAALSCVFALACATGEDLGEPSPDDFPVGGAGPMPSSTVPGGAGGFVPMTGGTPPIGGAPVTGGAPATGGAPPITGGAPATGGAPPITGGAPATGGAPNMDVERCLSFSAAPTPCEQCACSQCTQATLDCFDSGDMARDEDCQAIVRCGQENSCSGVDCYCGTMDATMCQMAATPGGPCVAEIQAAAGTADFAAIADFFLNDMTHAIYLAGIVGGCAFTSCPSECGF